MPNTSSAKGNPAAKRMMNTSKKAKRAKNKTKNDAMKGSLTEKEFLRHERDLKNADYFHPNCHICNSRKNHHQPKKEQPYAFDFGKWMAKLEGTPGALAAQRERALHLMS